jgi:hypothetical protein
MSWPDYRVRSVVSSVPAELPLWPRKTYRCIAANEGERLRPELSIIRRPATLKSWAIAIRVHRRHTLPSSGHAAPKRYTWEIFSEGKTLPVEESADQFRSWEEASQAGKKALEAIISKSCRTPTT